jgi:hypothetical protein
VQQYNLVVQASYLKEYHIKVRQFVMNSKSNSVYESLQETSRAFSSRIRTSLWGVKDTFARLMSMQDAYHVTLNASDQVGKITSSLFQLEPRLNCERLNLAYFYDLVCEGLEGTLLWARSQSELPLQIQKVLEIVNELSRKKQELMLYTGPNYELTKTPDIEVQSLSTEADYPEDNSIWKRSLDELVEFISPTVKSKRKKRRHKGKAATTSPTEPSYKDLEVEEFKLRLSMQRPAQCRVKPNLNSAWLKSLCLQS